jgi:hypothetical protein
MPHPMTASRMRRVLRRLAAVTFLLIAAGTGVFSVAFKVFAVDVVALSRIDDAGAGSWVGRPAAWQWDAVAGLGLAGALVAASVVAMCVRGLRRGGFAAAAAWLLIEGALLALVSHASPNSGADLVLWQLGGAALVVAALGPRPR